MLLSDILYSDQTGKSVEIMLMNGAKVNENENAKQVSPLHLAVAQDNIAAVEAIARCEESDVNLKVWVLMSILLVCIYH